MANDLKQEDVIEADGKMATDIVLLLGLQRHPGQALPPHLDGSNGANRPRTVNGDVAPCPNIEGVQMPSRSPAGYPPQDNASPTQQSFRQ